MAMPFSTVFKPISTSAVLRIPPEFLTGSSSNFLTLPIGVVQVIVTWRGLDGINIRHYRGGVGWENTHKIPASTTAATRTSGVLTLASDVSHMLELVHVTEAGNRWNATTLSNGYVAGVQVIPLSTPGGV